MGFMNACSNWFRKAGRRAVGNLIGTFILVSEWVNQAAHATFPSRCQYSFVLKTDIFMFIELGLILVWVNLGCHNKASLIG